MKKERNGKFSAIGCLNYREYHLGTFLTASDAGKAFSDWAIKTFGEYYPQDNV